MSRKDETINLSKFTPVDFELFTEDEINQLMWLIQRVQKNKKHFEKYKPHEIEKFRIFEDLFYSTDDSIDDDFKLNIYAGHEYEEITKINGDRFIFDIQPILGQLKLRGYIEDYQKKCPDEVKPCYRITLDRINFEAFDDLFEALSQSLTDGISNKAPKKQLITKNDSGDFYYQKKRIQINKETLHYQILEVLVDSCDQDGVIPYEKIISYLKQEGRKDNNTQWSNRISNAIKDGLMKAKIENKCLGDFFSDKKPLIKPIHGLGLIFNNYEM